MPEHKSSLLTVSAMALGVWCACGSVWASGSASLQLDVPTADAPEKCTLIPSGDGAGLQQVRFSQTFVDTFDTFKYDGTTWEPRFDGDPLSMRKHTLVGNGEQQLYVDPGYAGNTDKPLGLNPFSVANGALTITARRVPETLKSSLYNYPYYSGMITSRHLHLQTYGYFEANVRLPAGSSIWPAVWLLQSNGQWPPEIDIVELFGQTPDRVFMTTHWKTSEKSHAASRCKFRLVNATEAFHRFGVLWTANRIVYYIDHVPQGYMKTPPGLDQPMYMLINLAVGGKRVGQVDENTPDVVKLVVDEVAAYTLVENPNNRASAQKVGNHD